MSLGSKGNFNAPFSLAPLHKPFIFLNLCLYSADLLARAELGCLHSPATFLTLKAFLD